MGLDPAASLALPLAFDPKHLGPVLRLFTDTVGAWYRRQHPYGKTGSVTVIQRASSDLRLNLHFHTLFFDGVYALLQPKKGGVASHSASIPQFHPATSGSTPASPAEKRTPVRMPLASEAALEPKGYLCAQVGAFNLHAARRVAPNDKQGKEMLCRYILRPPLANERLHLLADGSVTVEFKRPWSDGTPK